MRSKSAHNIAQKAPPHVKPDGSAHWISSANISLRELRAFLYVAEYSSFTRAAEQLNITQAGLSAMIRNLETQLNCRLFFRTTRLVTLTDMGIRFMPLARRTVEDFATVASEFSAVSAASDRLLRIGATPVVCSQLLPEVSNAFRKRRPDVTVQISEIPRDQIRLQVRKGDIDVGLSTNLKSGGDLRMHRLFKTSLLSVSQASELSQTWADYRPIGRLRWADLPDQPLIGLPPDDPLQQLVECHLRRVSAENLKRVVVSQIETQIAMAAAGLGTAIVPSLALPACRRYSVDIDLLVEPTASMDFCHISKSDRRPTAMMNEYYETLVSVLSASFDELPD